MLLSTNIGFSNQKDELVETNFNCREALMEEKLSFHLKHSVQQATAKTSSQSDPLKHSFCSNFCSQRYKTGTNAITTALASSLKQRVFIA
ncbi:hypothetical protein BpHYR1_014603 [Brachionus plicatilis]|uniref:Uncharacterized protein n=1 Tax=Brachionus plicatilis TaxID=10195 RepID=A0A3M7PVC3_BRAPC|nr:hypothetical protein BpHYR1_014603 [Brachionus plicatilis]